MTRISILNRYIGRELLLTWLSVVLVLMLILSSGSLTALLSKASNGLLPSDAIGPLLAIAAARYLIFIVPLSMFIGVLLSFGRLYKDNEMAALSACGVSFFRLYRPLLTIVIPVSLCLGILTFHVMPWLADMGQRLQSDMENRSTLTGLIAGRFNPAGSEDSVIFLERQSKDGKSMENVFLQGDNEQGMDVQTASTARRIRDDENRQFVLFGEGHLYQGKPGDSGYRITHYHRYGIFVPDTETDFKTSRTDGLPTEKLWNSDQPRYQAELQWRIAMPVATFIMAIMALPLSHTTPRQGRYARLAVAILIYLFYSNLLTIGQKWMGSGKTPEWIGLWWIHIVPLFIILYLWIRRLGGFRNLYRRMRTGNKA